MTWNSVAAVGIAISMLAAPAAGQSIGASLAGVVRDESGARFPGVTLTLTNTANGRTQTVISDARGEFRAVALQPAPYRVAAEHSGFARLEQDVTLNVGSELTIDIQLTLSSRSLNMFRAHWFTHTTGGVPHTLERTPGIQRPSVTTGQTMFEWQTFWRTRVVLSDAVFMSRGNHDVRLGGDLAFGHHVLDSHYLEDGMFIFGPTSRPTTPGS